MISMNCLIAALLVLVLNLLWELAQGPFYLGHENFWQTLPMCARAAVGDLLIVAAIFASFALLSRDREWYRRLGVSGWIMLMTVGAAVAMTAEWWALSTGRWRYSAAMPMLPMLDVGLLPVLQMMVIPAVVITWLRRKQHR